MFTTKILKTEEKMIADRNEITAGFAGGSVDVSIFKKFKYSKQKQG